MTVNPRSVRRRLIKPEACSRARRRKFFLKEPKGWRKADFRESYQYRLIQDIWEHQVDLAGSSVYQELLGGIRRGKAFHHRTGRRHFVVDTEEGLFDDMSGYLKIMQGMQADGYRIDAAPNELTVTVAANGELLATSGGKRRLAMAQVLGLTRTPTRISHMRSAWARNHARDAREPACEALMRVMQTFPGGSLA
ncbi:hypothetical protein SAMN05444515_10245 [Ectothiorhodospira marina]|uniref:Uncharacterized protein n=2 Tax=Ectothiorhodospira marina TaxID=1396821 RepID=A0A1H7H270_9GAMM|nr:hypothetical protein SAMN05444515_10245 [Ectothiorhodospira marina]